MWYLWLDKQYAFCFVHIGDCRVNFTLLLPSQRFDCSFSFSLRLSLSVSISDSIWLNEIYSLITLILIRWTNYIYEFVFLRLFSSSSSLKCCSKTCFAHCLYRVRFWSKKKLKSKSVICWCFFSLSKACPFSWIRSMSLLHFVCAFRRNTKYKQQHKPSLRMNIMYETNSLYLGSVCISFVSLFSLSLLFSVCKQVTVFPLGFNSPLCAEHWKK